MRKRADLFTVADNNHLIRESRNHSRRWLARGVIAMLLGVVTPSALFADITTNSTSSGSTAGATSLTWSHMVNSGIDVPFVGISMPWLLSPSVEWEIAGVSIKPALATTLGNGTDPGSASLAPGGAPTMADASTFATDSGTDAITAVTVTLAAGTI